MRRALFVLVVAGVAVAITGDRAGAQQDPLAKLIEKAKQKLQKPVQCVETDQACIERARRAGAQVKLLPPPPSPRTDDSTAAGNGPALAPSASGAAVPSGEFAGPAVTYLSLFKMWMAANADVLGTDEQAAWEYYLLTGVPTQTRLFSRECMALFNATKNEIAAESAKARALAEFKTALAESGKTARTGTYYLRTWESVEAYDLKRGVFPLSSINSKIVTQGAWVAVPRTTTGLVSPEELRSPKQATEEYCQIRPAFPGVSTNTVPSFELEFKGQEGLKEFPMERGAAEAFLNANPERFVALEVVLEVGPVPFRADSRAGHGIRVPARIVAARVLDRNDGRVLHTFAGLAPEPTATSSTTARSADDTVPFSGKRALLLTLRDHPDFATADALLDATRAQVGAEQLAWRNIDYLTNPTNGGLPRYRWNPKRQAFFYEWQSLIENQPDLARGPVLEVFLREDCDWSFVTRDPAWDPRFDALVGVFLFSRDKIDGREPSFAAQELMPVYKRHLEMAVAKAPTRFWFMLPVAGFTYDFAGRSLRVSGVASGRRPQTDEADLLGPPPLEPEVALPEGAQGRAVYTLFGISRITDRSISRSVTPGVAFGAPVSPTDDWRNSASIGSSSHKIPLPGILALDRRLHVAAIPMEPAQAEPLVNAQRLNPGTGVLSARVYFDAERVDIGGTVIDRQRERAAVLIAKVRRIELVTSDNRVVATVAAAELPAPAIAAPAAPTAPVPVKSGPTPAELETARRKKLDEQEAEQTRKTLEGVHKSAEKEQKCVAEAMKVDPGMGKAFREAVAACMAK